MFTLSVGAVQVRFNVVRAWLRWSWQAASTACHSVEVIHKPSNRAHCLAASRRTTLTVSPPRWYLSPGNARIGVRTVKRVGAGGSVVVAVESMLVRLREETRASHARVDALPFFAALQAGTLPRASYVAFLEALATVREALEEAAAVGRDPLLDACWATASRRLPLLQRDLDHFREERSGSMSESLLHALMLAEEFALRVRRDPASLAGSLYVLEGAGLGGLVLRPHAARAFGLADTSGLAYLTGDGRRTRVRWDAFTGALEMAARDPDVQERVVAAALETFDGLERLVLALHPGDTAPAAAGANTLNPEAGSHAITDDPREIRAALRAGVRSWERCPYYEWRYGRRGRRFTRSDSVWLVTLATLPQASVDHQIAWLGRILAARGMPQWLLERHLQVLHDELADAVSARRDDYGRLLAAAQRLRERRVAVLDEEVQRALAMAFDAAVGADWARRLPDSGTLLVAAVCDEVGGVRHAVASLAGWMTDPERFPPPWIAAVRQTLAEAGRLASPGD